MILFLVLPLAASAATIITDADCAQHPSAPSGGISITATGGGVGATHAECRWQFSYSFYGEWRTATGSARADVITNGGFARVETGIDIDRFHGGLAQSNAYWSDQVTLTFLGADGGGFFMPCVSMGGGGNMRARFELAGTAPTVSGLPSRQGLTFGTPPTPDQNCGTSLATPGNGLGFFFNVPFRMNIELVAGMSENTSRSWFDSNYLSFDSFAVSRFPECSGATCSYFPEPAVWLMEPVPEPGLGLIVAVLLVAIVGCRHRGVLLTFFGAVSLPAATIFTSASCSALSPIAQSSSGGGPGSPHAECSVTVIDRGNPADSSARADAGDSYARAIVSAHPRAPQDVRASASWQEQFLVTIFGDEGGGFFQPCISVGATQGNVASVRTEMAGELPVIAGGSNGSIEWRFNTGGISTTCTSNHVDPGNYALGFYYNVPFVLRLTLTAEASLFAAATQQSGAQAVFYGSLMHSRIVEYPEGGGIVLPAVGDPSTWTMERVPEPALPLATATLCVALAALRRRA